VKIAGYGNIPIVRVPADRAGASLADVVRTRVMLTDIRQRREVAGAHTRRFA
jgi:hypothetical protein